MSGRREGLAGAGEAGYGRGAHVVPSDRMNLMELRLPLVLTSLLMMASCGKSGSPAADAGAPTAPPTTATAPVAAGDAQAVGPDAAVGAADTAGTPDAEAGDPKDCVPNEVSEVIGGMDPEISRLNGGAVEVCGLMGEARRCVVTDLASNARSVLEVEELDVDRMPSYPAGFDDDIIRDEKRPVVKVCLSAEQGCKDLDAGQILTARFDATRSQVVMTTWDGGRKARVYDTATLELKHTIDIAEGEVPDCTFARFVGANLVVSTGPCNGGGTSWLVEPATGKKVADIGGETPLFIKDGQFVAVPQAGENAWAFRSADGDHVVMQDVVTGAVLGRLDLKEAVGDTTPKHDGAWVLNHESGLVLVESRPVPDSIYVVDPKTMVVGKTLLPRPCD